MWIRQELLIFYVGYIYNDDVDGAVAELAIAVQRVVGSIPTRNSLYGLQIVPSVDIYECELYVCKRKINS